MQHTSILPPVLPANSPPSVRSLFEQWLDAAESWATGDDQASYSPVRQRPVLFVGLGDAGKAVLTLLADYLRARWGEPWPHHVRLLHIGVSGQSEAGEHRSDVGFPSVVLYLDADRRKKLSVQQVAPRLGRFDEGRLRAPGRALGPIAVLADLAEGKVRSRLWSALNSAVGDLKDLSVYVVSDAFSDQASGMIADIGHLLRQVARRQIGWVALCLATQHAQWRDDLSATRRGERTFATLRELQRLERAPVRFTYAPHLGQPELDAKSEVPLFDEIFLFDGRGEERTDGYRHDLSHLSAEDGLLPAVAGCLIALLDRYISQGFYQDVKDQLTLPMRRGQLALENRVGAMGSFALRLPVEEMRRVVECRIVHKCLFDRKTGIIEWEELDEAGEPQCRGDLPSTSVGPVGVEAFFQARGLSLETVQRLSASDFHRHLLAFLETQMNVDGRKQVQWAQQFVVTLRDALPDRGDELAKVEQALQAWIEAVGESLGPVSIDPLADFLGIGSQAREVEVSEGPLYKAWWAQWEQARELFARVSRMHGHRLVWELDQECDFFRRFFERERPWERIQRRLWWCWVDRAGQPELRLLIVPADLDEPDPRSRYRSVRETIRRNPAACADTARDAEQIVVALLGLARQFSRVLADQDFAFGPEEIDGLAKELQQKASCLYRGHRLGEARIAVEPFHYFTAPDHPLSLSLAQAIQNRLTAHRPEAGVGTFHFRFLPSEHSTECRLLHVQHVLPLNNMEAYVEAREKYTPRVDLHVFEPEQVAVLWEEKGRRRVARDATAIAFSPWFVDMLARDQEGMALFGRCILYDLIRVDPATLHVKACEEDRLEDLLDRTVYQAAEEFLSLLARSPDQAKHLKETVEGHRMVEYDEKVTRLDRFRDEVVIPLSHRGEPDAQDLALLLAAVIWDEERGS